jgi:hypothetical protein
MEAMGFFAILVPLYQTTQHRIPEESNVHIYRYENLKYHIYTLWSKRTDTALCEMAWTLCRAVILERVHSTSLCQIAGRPTTVKNILFSQEYIFYGLPLWSSGQSSWSQIQRSRVRFPALPDFLRSSGSGMGSIQPREYDWGAIWKEK